MQEPPIPRDEDERIEALLALEILDTPREERFDRITRMVAHVLDVPIALVSLVDRDRQWFKSCIGLEGEGTDRSVSFCAHAILSDDVFVVPDALEDPRFADNPSVVGDPHVRFYAGQPLHAPNGQRVGTLCAIDTSPRQPSAVDLRTLADLASWAELELGAVELERALAAERATESRLMSVLASIGEGVATFDITGTITSVNYAAEALFKRSAYHMVGTSVAELVVPEDRPRVFQALAERAESEVGNLFRGDLNGLRGDGSTVPMEVTVSEVYGHEGELFIAIARDLTERRRSEAALADLRHRNESILESVGEGIVGVDTDGLVTFANAAACQMLLCEVDRLIGANFHQTFHHTRLDGSAYPWEDCPVHATLAGGSAVREHDELYWRPDGSAFDAEFISTPLTEGGEITGAVVSFRDVTARRAMERMKDEFVSVVSHELRTPLTSIRGSLGLLAGGVYGELPEDAGTMLAVAVANSDRLIRLVNDILDFERLRSGQVELDLADIDLREVAEQAVQGVASDGVEVAVVGGGVRVQADPHRMVQVLTNLVGNAVKFSEPGGRVEVATELAGTDAVVRVVDQGRGIPPDLLETIFDRFQQVDASDAREKGGTGLGLAIARGIVEQHGGRIWAESIEGEGATFSVALPGGSRRG